MEEIWKCFGLGNSRVGDASEQTELSKVYVDPTGNRFWAYNHEETNFKFCQPYTAGERQDISQIKEISLQRLLDGWRQMPRQGETERNDGIGTQNHKLIISVFGWNSEDYDFRHKRSHVALMTEDLVRMVADTGSFLTFQGTEGNTVFSALGQALTDHQRASFMAVLNNDYVKQCCSCFMSRRKDSLESTEFSDGDVKPSCFCYTSEKKDKSKYNSDEKERKNLSKAIVENHKWMEKCIICENIVDIRGSEDVCECTVVINGDIRQIKTVIRNCVAKKRPVILVKGLGKVMNDLAVLIQKKKTPASTSNVKAEDAASQKDLEKFVEKLCKKRVLELLHVYDVDYDRSAGKNTLPSASNNADSGSESIEGKILTAVAKRFEKEIQSPGARHRQTLLEMCIECDQFDAAKSGGLLPKEGKVLEKETLVKAITCGRDKFVHYFLDPRLNFDADKTIIEEEVDDWYREYADTGLSLKKESLKKESLKKESLKKESLKKEVERLIPTVSLQSLQSKRKNNDGEKQSNGNMLDGEKQSNGNMLDGEDLIRRDIFIYAVLTDKYELAKVMLGHVHQHTAAALLASGLLRAKAKETDKNRTQYQEYKEKSREFGQLAENSITRGYDKFPTKTFQILRRKMEAWGNVSLMFLAKDTKNKDFLMLEPCYRLQETVWEYGDRADERLKGPWTQKKSERSRLIRSGHFSPYDIYLGNLYALVLFLVIFAFVLVSHLETEKFHGMEIYVMITVCTFLLQEVEQVYRVAFRRYFYDYFNIVDLTSIVAYGLAFLFRIAAYYNPSDTYLMDTARPIFSASFALFTLRLLRFCYIFKKLAFMVMMITKMVKILLKFLGVLAIFFLAYAVASWTVLYPQSKISWALVFHVLRRPYWNMFGELFMDELEADGSDPTLCTTDPNLYDDFHQLRCVSESGRYIEAMFLGIYVLIVNILLFNLLIALLSSEVQKVEAKSKALWSFQRYVILSECSRYMLPFPFTVLTLLLWGFGPAKLCDPYSYVRGSPLPYDELNTMERQTRHEQEVEDKRESQLLLMGIAKTESKEKILIYLSDLNCTCTCRKEGAETRLESSLLPVSEISDLEAKKKTASQPANLSKQESKQIQAVINKLQEMLREAEADKTEKESEIKELQDVVKEYKQKMRTLKRSQQTEKKKNAQLLEEARKREDSMTDDASNLSRRQDVGYGLQQQQYPGTRDPSEDCPRPEESLGITTSSPFESPESEESEDDLPEGNEEQPRSSNSNLGKKGKKKRKKSKRRTAQSPGGGRGGHRQPWDPAVVEPRERTRPGGHPIFDVVNQEGTQP